AKRLWRDPSMGTAPRDAPGGPRSERTAKRIRVTTPVSRHAEHGRPNSSSAFFAICHTLGINSARRYENFDTIVGSTAFSSVISRSTRPVCWSHAAVPRRGELGLFLARHVGQLRDRRTLLDGSWLAAGLPRIGLAVDFSERDLELPYIPH